jgi:hypothetical protein
LAYPEEPQRPLTAPPAALDPAPAPLIALPGGIASSALAIFAVSVLACLAAYVALSVPGAWFPGAVTKIYGVRDLLLTRGAGAIERDALKGDALAVSAVDASGLALITINTDFRSSEYPIIAWTGGNFPERADVRFLWRTDYAPAKLNSTPVTITAGRLAPLVMTKNPDWVGRIMGIALAVRGPLGEPVGVSGVTARPGGAAGQLVELIREWLTFERWSGASINTITGGADVQELPLPTFLVVALLATVGVWFALARRVRRTTALPAVLAMLFVVAWLLLDMQWVWNLARQVDETRAQFGGKDWRERHLVADDGALFQFIERARAKMPATPVRVFIVADADYFRGRGAYHLYPHNVLFDPRENTVPPVAALRPGDFVVVYQRRGIQYNAEEKKLRFEGGTPVSAEAVLVEPRAALFRIM